LSTSQVWYRLPYSLWVCLYSNMFETK
jgi:hypothetical protein